MGVKEGQGGGEGPSAMVPVLSAVLADGRPGCSAGRSQRTIASMSPSSDVSSAQPPRARSWRLRTRTLEFGPLPCLMGILNTTPDSFSDGGQYLDPQRAVDHALRLIAEGAEILDVGGESTRPYSAPVTTAEELARVMPVVEALAGQIDVPISIDTSKAEVARAALVAGAEIINDVSACTADPAMLDVVLAGQAGLCAMHMQGTPQTMQDEPRYADVVAEILAYLGQRLADLTARGVEPARICLDPGIGFGKTTQHNLTLLRHCAAFHELGCPLLLGFSRKGFIGKILGDMTLDREAGGIGIALAAARQGVQVLRLHEVGLVRQALCLFEACGGLA